jgi:O-antigen ligase
MPPTLLIQSRLCSALGWTAVVIAAFLSVSKFFVNAGFAFAVVLAVIAYALQPRLLKASLANPVVVGALALFLLYAASVLWTNAPPKRVPQLLSSYRVLLFPLVFFPVMIDPRWRERVLVAIVAGLGVTLFLSIVQSVTPLPFTKATQHGVGTTNAYVWNDHIRQNVHMTFLYLWALGTFLFARHLPSPQRIGLLLLTAVVAVDMLLLVQGRTGYLTIAAVTVVLARERYGGWKGVIGGVAVVSLVFGALLISSDTFSNRVQLVVSEAAQHLDGRKASTSIGLRLEMWSSAMSSVPSAPFFGHGLGSFDLLARQDSPLIDASGSYPQPDPHNEFLHVAVEIGTVGLAASIIGLVALWRLARRFEERWCWLTRGAVGIYVSAALVNGLLHIGWTGSMFCMWLAIAAGLEASRRQLLASG